MEATEESVGRGLSTEAFYATVKSEGCGIL
jgi:hypothetical protein